MIILVFIDTRLILSRTFHFLSNIGLLCRAATCRLNTRRTCAPSSESDMYWVENLLYILCVPIADACDLFKVMDHRDR